MPALQVSGKSGRFCLAAAAVGFALLWGALGTDPAFSFLAGAVLAYIYLAMMNRQIIKSLTMHRERVRQAVLRGLFFRYLFLIAALALVSTVPAVRPVWLLAGIALIPVSVVAAAWRRA